jgi:hypothetical protein
MAVSNRNHRLLAELIGALADRMNRLGLRTEGDVQC